MPAMSAMSMKPWRVLYAAAAVCCALAGAPPSAEAESDFYPRPFTNPYTGGSFASPGASYLATVMRNRAMRQAARQAAFAGLVPGNPSFKIVNTGSSPIVAVFLLHSDRTEWSGNLLTDGRTIAVGHEVTANVTASEGCDNSVRVIFADGQKWQHMHINTCVPTRVSFPVPE